MFWQVSYRFLGAKSNTICGIYPTLHQAKIYDSEAILKCDFLDLHLFLVLNKKIVISY